MVNEPSKVSPDNATGTKNKTPERPVKVGTRSQVADTELRPTSGEIEAEALMIPQQEKHLPTKGEIAEMFAKLEASIKEEISTVHENMSHILKRVEEVENTMDKQEVDIKNLITQMEALRIEQRNTRYRMEDQENRSRRKNLRIRGLPETQGEKENLQDKMEEIFKDLRKPSDDSNKLKVDRVHRIRKPAEIREDVPRDVIVRFHNYQDKEEISSNLRKNMQAKYGEISLQIFQDLSAETLNRRRTLKPLLATLITHEVQYSWGFPACLIGRKEGRSATLRFPEETQQFCQRLGIPLVEILGWWEKITNQESTGEPTSWKPIISVKEYRRQKGQRP